MARVDANDAGIGVAFAAFAAYGVWRGWAVVEPLVAVIAAVGVGIVVAESIDRRKRKADADHAPSELVDPVPRLVDAILLLAVRKGARHVALREREDGAIAVLHQCGAEWTEQLRPPAHLRPAIVDELRRRAGAGDGFTVQLRDRAIRVDVGFTVDGDLVHLVVDPAPPN